MRCYLIFSLIVCTFALANSYVPPPPPSSDYVIKDKPSERPHNFESLISKSIRFYEAQRCGHLPADNRIAWRGDSFLYDAGKNGEDLTGGWFDAGDHVKFGLPMAWTTSILAWSFLEFREGYKGGLVTDLLDSIKWPCDYFVKCHTKPNEFYFQVADANLDHAYWDRPEDLYYEREAYIINGNMNGTDVCAAAAAALAACSIAFSETGAGRDTTLAEQYLNVAISLFNLADKGHDFAPLPSHHYSNRRWEDELLWASIWLHKATGDIDYLTKAETMYGDNNYSLKARSWAFDFQDTKEASRLLLYVLTGNEIYRDRLERHLNGILPHHGNLSTRYTPKGLYFRSEWGPLRYTANTAFLALVAAQHGIHPKAYREFACNQTNYILGNDIDHSYVIGYGTDPPCRPHHRSSSCPGLSIPCNWGNAMLNEGCNYHELTGAMVGGPNMNDEWTDNRQDYRSNEVGLDYNAGFQGAMAGLQKLKKGTGRDLPPACYIRAKKV